MLRRREQQKDNFKSTLIAVLSTVSMLLTLLLHTQPDVCSWISTAVSTSECTIEAGCTVIVALRSPGKAAAAAALRGR
jgi:hypothetical protein